MSLSQYGLATLGARRVCLSSAKVMENQEGEGYSLVTFLHVYNSTKFKIVQFNFLNLTTTFQERYLINELYTLVGR